MAGAVANPAMKATVDKHFDLFMRSYAPAEIEKETLTAEQLEEYEARAKEYSKMKMAQHRAWQKDIAGKIRHKLVAIKSLPEGFIRDAAAAPGLLVVFDEAHAPVADAGDPGVLRGEAGEGGEGGEGVGGGCWGGCRGWRGGDDR